MAKKTKLRLENLRVESFVTSLDEEEKKSVKGGAMAVKTDWLCPLPFDTEGYGCFGPLPSHSESGGFDTACQCPPDILNPY